MSQLFTHKYKSNVKTFPKYADIIFAILLAPTHMWLGSTATEDDLTLRIRTFSCYMLTIRSSLCWKTHDNGHKPHSSVQKDSESCHLQNTICSYRQLPLSTVSDNHLKMQKEIKIRITTYDMRKPYTHYSIQPIRRFYCSTTYSRLQRWTVERWLIFHYKTNIIR